jgi:hypothetical protein
VGPSPNISILFFTGSVVVPGVSETIAASSPESLLINELLPEFLLPKTPIYLALFIIKTDLVKNFQYWIILAFKVNYFARMRIRELFLEWI